MVVLPSVGASLDRRRLDKRRCRCRTRLSSERHARASQPPETSGSWSAHGPARRSDRAPTSQRRGAWPPCPALRLASVSFAAGSECNRGRLPLPAARVETSTVPRPMSRRLPSTCTRKSHVFAPVGLTSRYSPSPSACRPGFAFFTVRAVRFAKSLAYPFPHCDAVGSGRQRTVTEHTFLTCFDLGGKSELQRTVANS